MKIRKSRFVRLPSSPCYDATSRRDGMTGARSVLRGNQARIRANERVHKICSICDVWTGVVRRPGSQKRADREIGAPAESGPAAGGGVVAYVHLCPDMSTNVHLCSDMFAYVRICSDMFAFSGKKVFQRTKGAGRSRPRRKPVNIGANEVDCNFQTLN